MALLLAIVLLSIASGFVLIYFTGLADLSPYFWFLLPVVGIFGSGILISIAWGGLLLAAAKYKNEIGRAHV